MGDADINAIFREFDTSGDGFIDLSELESALLKAGKPVTREAAEDILKRVDKNADGQISLEEFREVFRMAPDGLEPPLRKLTDVSSFFLDSLGRVTDALGIEVPGQWRNTPFGSRYVDDVVGSGNVVLPGDVVQIHYTVTLVSTDRVVETTRGGPPLGFQLGEPSPGVQNWDDAVAGMRVGGQRRVYATPQEGEGSTARYDLEVVAVEEGVERSGLEKTISLLGGRRAATRLLFAASFIPYFLPEQYQPAFFRNDGGVAPAAIDAEPGPTQVKVDKSDEYVSKQLDALFSNDLPPTSKRPQ